MLRVRLMEQAHQGAVLLPLLTDGILKNRYTEIRQLIMHIVWINA